jgi:hypothetical protein
MIMRFSAEIRIVSRRKLLLEGFVNTIDSAGQGVRSHYVQKQIWKCKHCCLF